MLDLWLMTKKILFMLNLWHLTTFRIQGFMDKGKRFCINSESKHCVYFLQPFNSHARFTHRNLWVWGNRWSWKFSKFRRNSTVCTITIVLSDWISILWQILMQVLFNCWLLLLVKTQCHICKRRKSTKSDENFSFSLHVFINWYMQM